MDPIPLYPHQIFSLDFNQIINEAQRQEEDNPINKGELDLAKRIKLLIEETIGNQISTNHWIYEGCVRFAEEFAPEYIDRITLTGDLVVKYQNQLLDIKQNIIKLLFEFSIIKKAHITDSLKLERASEFIEYIDEPKLNKSESHQVAKLLEKAMYHENLQLKLTLDGISDLYEVGFTRVMFVLRRALKAQLSQSQKTTDDKLLTPSDYLDWIQANLNSSHVLVEYFADEKPATFYKTSRNVSNHHRPIQINWEENTVNLVDDKLTLQVPLTEFQQRYRYLNYLVDYGVRGILYYFSNEEKGSISNNVCQKYEKLFPIDLPDKAIRSIKLYE